MNNDSSQKILIRLENSIATDTDDFPLPMPGDKWLLSSTMQKAIRRGELQRALRAGASLWHSDRQNFWRRLHIIAVEDVGPVSVDAVVKTLIATSLPAWRQRMGDLSVGLHLIRLLCEAEKTRMTDELFIQIERAPEHAALRERLSKADDDMLAQSASDEDSPLISRAMSLLYLAGSRKFPSEVMPERKGSPLRAVEVIKGLNVPPMLIEACQSVAFRTQWPLAIFTPLVFQEISKQREPLYLFRDAIPVMDDVEGIPIYGADMFTRIGQSSMRQLQRTVLEFKPFSIRQIGLALFYAEGQRLHKHKTCDFMDEFRCNAEAADLEGAGLPIPEYMWLRDCMVEYMPTLNEIRREQLHRYLNGAAE